MSIEWDGIIADKMKQALVLVQQAESLLSEVKQMTSDAGLLHRAEDWMGCLSLVRESGNREYRKIIDMIDPG